MPNKSVSCTQCGFKYEVPAFIIDDLTCPKCHAPVVCSDPEPEEDAKQEASAQQEPVCPYCGKTISYGVIKCVHCKNPIVPWELNSPANQKTKPAPPATRPCPACQKPIDLTATSCEHCGSSWEITTEMPQSDVRILVFAKILAVICIGIIIFFVAMKMGAPPAETPEKKMHQTFSATEQKKTVNTPEQDFGHTDSYVENMIIKKVGNKYRYFFLIKNAQWGVDYDLSIVMKTGLGTGFNAYLSVAEATGGAGFYADFNTGPSYLQNMGANGMESFFYILTDNKTFRKSGQGRITRKLENYQY